MKRGSGRVALRYCAGCGCVLSYARVKRCAKCKAKHQAQQRKSAQASLSRQQKADIKLARMRKRLAKWEREARLAERRVASIKRKLKSAEKRYAWNAFVGWDKVVPMPRKSGDDDEHAAETSSEAPPTNILAGVRFINEGAQA